MRRVDLRKALDYLLPRFHKGSDRWNIAGRQTMMNGQVLTKSLAGFIHKAVRNSWASHCPKAVCQRIEWVDVSGDDVWFFHRTLWVKSLMWLVKRDFEWQRWKETKLPCIIRFRDKLIVWNGTHRTTLCRVAGKKVRAHVTDLNKFMEWRKSATPDELNGVKRRTNYGKAKRKAR